MKDKLEKLIGKHIDELPTYGQLELKGENYYKFKFSEDNNLFDVLLSNLILSTDNNKIVKMFYTTFPQILDELFYHEMVKVYGKPNNILANDVLINESKTEIKNESGKILETVAKRSYSMKEVKFEDKPTSIIWKKSYYEINILFYYNENGTQLIFKKKK